MTASNRCAWTWGYESSDMMHDNINIMYLLASKIFARLVNFLGRVAMSIFVFDFIVFNELKTTNMNTNSN